MWRQRGEQVTVGGGERLTRRAGAYHEAAGHARGVGQWDLVDGVDR
jgi:hypothetical protein